MLDFSVKKHFNLNNIKLDFSDDLNKGVDIVALDIEKGIESGGQFGVAFKRNAPKTIKKKGFDYPLKETGLMMDSGRMIKTKANRNHQIATLLPNAKRIEIGYWNDQGDGHLPRRHFWGISQKAEKEIVIRMAAKLDRELRKV